MEEYVILLADTYNTDEKGFMIGVLGRWKIMLSSPLNGLIVN
jgi:hypothetical protein